MAMWDGTTFPEKPEKWSPDDTTDDPSKIGTGAIKYDKGKPCTYRGLVGYFPRACTAVAEISTFGAQKYAWNGWEAVEDGQARYSDAMMRHIFAEATGESHDPESGLLHAAHAAWGALARLELYLREQENQNQNEIKEILQMAAKQIDELIDDTLTEQEKDTMFELQTGRPEFLLNEKIVKSLDALDLINRINYTSVRANEEVKGYALSERGNQVVEEIRRRNEREEVERRINGKSEPNVPSSNTKTTTPTKSNSNGKDTNNGDKNS